MQQSPATPSPTPTPPIPQRAFSYRDVLSEELKRQWGAKLTDEIVAVSAGTLHQESRWNPAAQSSHAQGLAQFTPDTWTWVTEKDRSIAEIGNVWNPRAAIRAMVWYHRWLLDHFTANESRWCFVLSAYNGGLGWVQKDQALAQTKGKDPLAWFGETELVSSRSIDAFKENRQYVSLIWRQWRPLYGGFLNH